MASHFVISKVAAYAYLFITACIILAVGLMVGLIPKSDEAAPIDTTGTTTPSAPVVTTTQQQPPDEPVPGSWDSIRLPLDLTPSLYKVDLKPYLEADADGMYWFDGVSEVTFLVEEVTKYIYIHSLLLEYSDVKVVDAEGADVGIATYSLYLPYQYLVVEMNSNFVKGETYTLKTTFRGELSDGLGGLYRSSYTDDAGNTKVLATTQMQPTDARKAFPCFDEPAMKAEFDIMLWHKDPNYAISNQPINTVEPMDGDWKRTTFDRTLKMSTYLLAFVVCDFSSVQGQTDVGDPITATIYARADQVAVGNADYARDITPDILEYYQQYFNVSYPLPKSDQIAVPDFNAGAMENWGLVIYRETALLYNPLVNSASNKQRVAAVVAHELAHQWFGNLITPQWWDELWLNEGFASYLEYYGTDYVEPTWGMEEQFLVSDFQRALEVDALTSSHPIVVTVNTPAEINEVFDTISYSKGACLIRMINSIVGDDAFKLGLTNYINAHKYGSVTHGELFAAWEDAITDDSIKPSNGFQDAMSTFTLQMGFPLVTMTRTSSGKMEITQERFLIDQEADPLQPTSPFNYKWDIPFNYVQESSSSSPTFMWIPRDQDKVEIDVNDGEWIIGNYKTSGYFRVNYDVEDWNRITTQLQNDYTQVDTSNRGQLLNDAFTLARIGKLDYGVALELTRYLADETEYIPWESALDSTAYFDLVLSRSKAYGPYSEYLLDLTTNLYNTLGWNAAADESILTVYNRINAISVKCFYGDDDCSSEATTRFAAWMTSGTNDISPDLKSLVYCNAVRYGKATEWDFMWGKYLTEKNSQEKSTLSGGLTCSREPWINQRFLTYITNDTYVRKQDASGLLEDLCGNDYARDLVWDYIRQNWDFIYETYGSGSFSFSGIIESCTAAFSTPFELKQLQDFLVDNSDKLGSGERAVQQALEQTQTNINWRANYEEDVYTWMADYVTTT